VKQVLNLFLALLLSSFSSENMKKNQQQDQNDVEDEEEEEAKTKDNNNQMTAAYERLQRWVKFVAVRLGSPMKPLAALKDYVRGKHHVAGLKATSTTDTACDLPNVISPDSTSASVQSPQPALLIDCSDRQVGRYVS